MLFSLDQKLYTSYSNSNTNPVTRKNQPLLPRSGSSGLKQISSMACTNQKHYQTVKNISTFISFSDIILWGNGCFLAIRLQLSEERLICFFSLIFRQTTAQLRAIILMSFKILCVPLFPRGPHVIHYVAQVQLMSNIFIAHHLCT